MNKAFGFRKNFETIRKFYTLYIYGCYDGDEYAIKKPTINKLYGVFDTTKEDGSKDTTLRAFKILKVIYINSWYKGIFYVNVAGLGEGYICTEDAPMYKSVEDFENNKPTTFEQVCSGEVFDSKNAIANSGMATPISGGSHLYMCRYKWEENKAVRLIAPFMVYYDTTTNSFSVELSPRTAEDLPYATMEECYAENTTAVCDFDDDDTKPIPFEVSVEVKTTISVTAKSKKDAEESVYRLISTAQSTLSQVSNNNVGSVITAKMKR